MVILMWPVPFGTLINYALKNKQFLLITTSVLLLHYHVPEAVWISTTAFGVMVAFWQAGCHLWICQQQDSALLCFCHSEHQDKSPCSLLPRGSAQQLPLCQAPLSQLPKQSGPSTKAAVRLLEKTAGNFWSKLILPYAPRSWKTACTQSWVLPLDTLSIEWNKQLRLLLFFYFTGTRGWSLFKRTK